MATEQKPIIGSYTGDSHRTVIQMPGEGETVSVGPDPVWFKVVTEDTGGAYCMMEITVRPDFIGPPLHVHYVMDEGFYVLEGELQLTVEDKQYRCPAGSWVLIAKGTPHTWGTPPDATQPARLHIIASPAGFEGFFYDLSALFAKYNGPPPLDEYIELFAKYDHEIVEQAGAPPA
jgi:quercetin dioxygenase-like cupin family protein